MKFAIGAVVIALAASVGTLGVAYYSDPTLFDSVGPGSACCHQKVTAASAGCCPFSSGTDCMATAECGKVCPIEAAVAAGESALHSID